MGVLADRLNDRIQHNKNMYYDSTVAVITSFDRKTNRASIRFSDPNGGSIISAENVAFHTQPHGIMTAVPENGQNCWITFLNGSILMPVITSLCDDEYSKTYSKMSDSNAGCYICPESILNTDTNIETTPMIDSYSMPDSGIMNCSSFDPLKDIREKMLNMDKYSPKEEGMTINGATIKVSENGGVSIFTDGNSGIRLNPDNTIDIYGNIRVNGKEVFNG